jgi:hypothetical protein
MEAAENHATHKLAVLGKQLGLSKTRGSFIPLQFPIGIDLNNGRFNYSNHLQSSSKAQIAA